MWRDRLGRRMAERERRREARDAEMGRRRGISAPGHGQGSSPGQGDGGMFTDADEEEEEERQARADDEEGR